MFPVMSEASIQMELQKKAAALQVSGCREFLGLLAGAREDGLLVHRCVLVKDPRHQVKELKQEFSRLCSIRDDEKEVDWILSDTWMQGEPDPPAVLQEGWAESVLIGLEKKDSNEKWQTGWLSKGCRLMGMREALETAEVG